jgi:hypothetical protein
MPLSTDDEAGQANERRVTAIHEAGHAVARIVLGLGCVRKIDLITFRDKDRISFRGLTRVLSRNCYSTLEHRLFAPDLLKEAAICAAGAVAEVKFCAGREDHAADASKADTKMITDICPVGWTVSSWFLAATSVAGIVLDEHWDAVLAVADAAGPLWSASEEPGEHIAELSGERIATIVAANRGRIAA